MNQKYIVFAMIVFILGYMVLRPSDGDFGRILTLL